MRSITPIGFVALLALVACNDSDDATPKEGGPGGSDDPGSSEDPGTDDPGTDDPGADHADPSTTDADGDGVVAADDCDDADASVFPGAEEVCDGIDNDCDGGIDVDATDAATWYADADADGYGDADAAREACAQPTGWVDNADDCEDSDAAVSPETRWYADADADGYGDAATAVQACEAPSGMVANGDDCDDADATTSPASTWYTDRDGDGYGDATRATQACEQPSGTVADSSDCNDRDASVSPETLRYQDADGDGYGDASSTIASCADVSGYVDDATDCDDTDAAVSPATRWYADTDADGYGDPTSATASCTQPAGTVADASDCDDKDATRSPDTVWYADADLDGYGDAASPAASCMQPAGFVADATDCDDTDGATNPATIRYTDADGDGYGDGATATASCELTGALVATAGDCDDADATMHPDTVWYADADGDGYGAGVVSVVQCAQPSGYTLALGDCNDGDATMHPATVWYADADGDRHGDPGATLTQCAEPSGFVQAGDDCDDAAASTFPGATEYCDGVDHDCDGDGYDSESADAAIWFRDVDGDGWGRETGIPTPSCTQPTGFVDNNGDCADTDGTAYPLSHWPEIVGDGVDQDCDGQDVCTDLDCDGYADVVFANWRETGSLYATDSYIYHFDGADLDWTDRTALPTTGAFAAEVADYNSDGYLDIAFAAFNPQDYEEDSIVFWGSASGHDISDSTTLDTLGARSMCQGDFDGDGDTDLLFPSYTGTGAVPDFGNDSVVYYADATGFSGGDSTALTTTGAIDCAVADLDGDGYDDAVVVSTTEDTTDTSIRFDTTSHVFYGSSAGLSDSDVTDLSTYGGRRAELVDVDLDGNTDIVITNMKTSDGVASHSNDAFTIIFWSDAGTFDDADATELETWATYSSATADFNGDGYVDIAVAQFLGVTGANDGSLVWWGSATGYDAGNTTTLATRAARWMSAADLDNDGYMDLVVSNNKDGGALETDSFIYYGSSSGLSDTDRADLPTVGTLRHTIADVDGDGWKDVIFANFSSPTTGNRVDSYVYYNSETGFDSSDMDAVATFGTRWAPIVVGRGQ